MKGVLAVIFILLFGSFMNSVPKNYWNSVKPTGVIEQKYTKLGTYTVTSKEFKNAPEENNKSRHYIVWYPVNEGKYPLIVMVNGTGVACDKYQDVFKHLASWGFVVIGNNYDTNWSGERASQTLDFALNTKEISDKIDTDKIGIGGHSQGGMGVFNAITRYSNGKKYKAAFSISPTNKDVALGLKWGFDLDTNNACAFDLSKIHTPMLIAAATGTFDSETVSPLKYMQQEFNELPDIPKVLFRKTGIDHGDMLYQIDGYTTAWLMYYLKNDEYAKDAFFGSNPEIKNNSQYQDYQSNE